VFGPLVVPVPEVPDVPVLPVVAFPADAPPVAGPAGVVVAGVAAELDDVALDVELAALVVVVAVVVVLVDCV
jgi:hypothetical protein